MFVLNKDKKLRRVLAMGLLFFSALAVDFSSEPIPNSVEARFLGTGKVVEKSPCIFGVRNVYTTYTVLWIKVGDTAVTQEAC